MFGYKANIINIAYEGILFSKPPRNSTGTSNRSQQCIARHTKMRSLFAYSEVQRTDWFLLCLHLILINLFTPNAHEPTPAIGIRLTNKTNQS